MKLIATLLVRDEADILGDWFDFHLAQGVDEFIVTDNRSVDETANIVKSYQRICPVHYVYEPDDTYAQSRWVTRMARMAASELDADWVVHSDADEFWWPEAGTLKSSLDEACSDEGFFLVPRVNFVPVPEDGRPWYERMVVRETFSLNDVGAPLPPKVCHRADPGIVVEQGNHAVRDTDLRPGLGTPPLIILHYPKRSWRTFSNKIAKGGAAYERNTELDPRTGRTWRELYKRLLAGDLPQWYEEQVMTPAAIARGMEAGQLVTDHRLRDYLLDVARPQLG